MSRKRRTRRQTKTGRLITAALVLGAVIVGGLAVFQRFAPGTRATLRDTDTAFSVPDHVGERALPFSAVNVNGQTYTITPGDDGRPLAIVFYMGFQ